MTSSPEIWDCMINKIPKDQWLALADIYRLIEDNINLDREDFDWQSPSSDIPKWKRNVRNVLQYRKKTGEIEWDGQGNYKI